LLYEVPKNFPDHRSPNEDLIEMTGFDIKSFSQLLMAGWAYNITVSPVLNIHITDDLKEEIPIITEENLQKCIDVFTADYRYYRNINFPNNPLFFKPIIKTDTNKLIVSNTFLWARKFYEGIYWMIRDKYMQQESQYFLNNFGKYYEQYIRDILAYYLKPDRYEKIAVTGNSQKADWLVYTGKYILIVEQKSCLMTIALKEEYPSLHKLDDYLDNFKEAYLQIAETLKDVKFEGKQTIKLILHFEKLYIGEALIKERVNNLCKDDIDNLSNYFFIETEEFEKLIQVLADDEEIFNRIIETKIDFEKNAPISAGREFHHIINKFITSRDVRFLDSYDHYFERLFGNIGMLDGQI
jgi:hypothetical protein